MNNHTIKVKTLTMKISWKYAYNLLGNQVWKKWIIKGQELTHVLRALHAADI
jgi:hypothetical protein